MKTSLLMNFTVNKEKNQINVKREFAAPRQKVWAAWTQSELLDQWWAPRPWKTETKSMDFSEGGMWLYSMVGPEGERHWCRNDYNKITPMKGFDSRDAFCDEDGNVNGEMPRANWSTQFDEAEGSTFVKIQTTYESLEALEMVIKMGMKEGFTAALENLDELLEAQTK